MIARGWLFSMKGKYLLLMIVLLCLAGCKKPDRMAESLKNHLIEQLEINYPDTAYLMHVEKTTNEATMYSIYGDNFHGFIYVRDGCGDLVLYSDDYNQLIFLRHVEEIKN